MCKNVSIKSPKIEKWEVACSVASAIVGVFANFPNKIAKNTGKFENVDETKNQRVFCQH